MDDAAIRELGLDVVLDRDAALMASRVLRLARVHDHAQQRAKHHEEETNVRMTAEPEVTP